MNADIDLSNVILKTERLTLRPWKETDLDDFYEYASVEGVGVMAGWNRHTSIMESKTILDRFIANKRTFAVEKNGKVIGSLGVEQYFERLFPELDSLKGRAIGYILSKDYWGKGLMPEVVKEVIKYLFEEVKLDFIMITCYKDNPQSQKVIEKNGLSLYKEIELPSASGKLKESYAFILRKENYK